MKRSIPLSKCKKCGILLSRDWPYEFCDEHWREKYHAPPGENYFPENGPAVKLAGTSFKSNHNSPHFALQHVSSSALTF